MLRVVIGDFFEWLRAFIELIPPLIRFSEMAGQACLDSGRTTSNTVHVPDLVRVGVLFADEDLRLHIVLLQLSLELRLHPLPQVRPLRVAVKHGQDDLALHGGTQRIVVAHLARDQNFGPAALEHTPPGAGAHSRRPDLPRRDDWARFFGRGDHDVPQTAEALGQAAHELPDGDGLGKVDFAAVARALEAGRGALCGDGLDRGAGRRLVVVGVVEEQINQPVVQAARDRVDGGVGAVDGDILLGELEEDALLGVCNVDGLETPEDERVCIVHP